MKRGDPCKTRMRVYWDGYWWRVFEITQPGQYISRHGDARFLKWSNAMLHANGCVRRDRALCQQTTRNTTKEKSWDKV